jgi:serine/threonine protein kinase
MFGRYELLDRIGLGGMAEVWRARVGGVGGFEKIVVIKKILPSFASNRTFIDMLLAEARLCAVLQHANVVQTYENGEIDGIFYIAMEYVPGHDLFKVLSRATQTQFRIPPEICLLVASEVAKGLHYAHNAKDHYGRSLNIIHRDVSPSNVIISESGEVKVMDFGVAKATPGGQRENATRSGVLKGKLGYMSPEQVTGRPFDHRSDIFSLGIILYESLTLKRLFLAKTDLETLVNIRDARIEQKFKKHAYIEEDIREILRKSLARDPAERYPTALAMHDDIMTVLFARRQHVSAGHLAKVMEELFDPSRTPVAAPGPAPGPAPTKPDAPQSRNNHHLAPDEPPPIPDSALAALPTQSKAEVAQQNAAALAAVKPRAEVAAVMEGMPLPASNSLSFSPEEIQKIRQRIAEKQAATGLNLPTSRASDAELSRPTVPVPVRVTGPTAPPPVPVQSLQPLPSAQSAQSAQSGQAVAAVQAGQVVAPTQPVQAIAPARETPPALAVSQAAPQAVLVRPAAAADSREQVASTQPSPFRQEWLAVAKPSSTPGFQPGAPSPGSGLKPRPSEFAVASPEKTDPAATAARLRAMRPELQTSPQELLEPAPAGDAPVPRPEPALPQPPGFFDARTRTVAPTLVRVGSQDPTEPAQDLFDSLSAMGTLPPGVGDFLDQLAGGGAATHAPVFAAPSGRLGAASASSGRNPVATAPLGPFGAASASSGRNPVATAPFGQLGAASASSGRNPVAAAPSGQFAAAAAASRPQPAVVAPPQLPPDPQVQESGEYRVQLADGSEFGPMNAANLTALLKARTIHESAMVAIGRSPLQPLGSIPVFRAVLAELAAQRKAPVLSGPLSQWILVRLIYRLHADRSSGCLELTRGDGVKAVYFRRGRIQYIASNLMEELIGPFMVSNGYVSQSDVDLAAQRAKDTGARLGDLLISMNKIKPFQLFQVLEQQLRAKLIQAFGWDSGQFAFFDGAEPPADIVPLDIDPVPMLAEGVRERISLATLEPLFADKLDRKFYPVRQPQLSISDLKLQARESKVLSLLMASDTARPAYHECYANRQQRLALLHVLFLLLQTDLLTFDPDRA